MVTRNAGPYVPITDQQPLKYSRQEGVESFAADFRNATWLQLLQMEINGVAPEFFADVATRMQVDPVGPTAQRLEKARENSHNHSLAHDVKANGRLAISLLRIINRTLDVFPDPEENAERQFDPWVFVGKFVGRSQLSLHDTPFIQHMDLMIGAEILSAGFSENFASFED